MDYVTRLLDAKQVVGAGSTAGFWWASYLDIIQPAVGIFFTVVVGSLTAWYTWERAHALRQKRLEQKEK